MLYTSSTSTEPHFEKVTVIPLPMPPCPAADSRTLLLYAIHATVYGRLVVARRLKFDKILHQVECMFLPRSNPPEQPSRLVTH